MEKEASTDPKRVAVAAKRTRKSLISLMRPGNSLAGGPLQSSCISDSTLTRARFHRLSTWRGGGARDGARAEGGAGGAEAKEEGRGRGTRSRAHAVEVPSTALFAAPQVPPDARCPRTNLLSGLGHANHQLHCAATYHAGVAVKSWCVCSTSSKRTGQPVYEKCLSISHFQHWPCPRGHQKGA